MPVLSCLRSTGIYFTFDSCFLYFNVMRFFTLLVVFALLVTVPEQSFAQKQVEISGVKYIMHEVGKGETVFTLCQKYKVSQKAIMDANPGLSAVLKAGSTVKVPVQVVEKVAPKQEPTAPAASETEGEFYYHKVAAKQTLFTIAKQYGITPNELIRNNPEITSGISAGQILKIPVNPTAENSGTANTGNQAEPDLSQYNVHPVVSGETIYGLEQRYGITHEEMMKFNPALQNGLKTGMKLKIPVKQTATVAEPATTQAEVPTTKYKVEQGETLFSLAARFGVEVGEIKKVNPALFSRGLEAGETILIPLKSAIKDQSAVKQDTTSPAVNNDNNQMTDQDCKPETAKNQKYKAALLLPLYLAGNDNPDASKLDAAQLMAKINLSKTVVVNPTDTTTVYAGVNIDPKALGFLEFYEGALLAVDSLKQRGMKIELYVFDVSNQKMVNALVQLDEFREMNLIIGPVYPELQETVAAFAAKNRIPMISPLASTGTLEQKNPWYFKVNPTREYQVEQTADYVAKEMADRNFIILQQGGNSTSADAQLAKLCKEKLTANPKESRFHEYNLQQGINGITPLMNETGENVFLIPTDSEAQVSVAVTNLTSLAERYNIVLVGTQVLPKLKSIQTENYHQIRLRFLSPYFVDYNRPLVRRFVGQFREKFAAEPTQFSLQGFDVAYYFMSAMFTYGKDFRNCISDYPMELTQMNFGFERVSPVAGFMNKSLFITGYERNFDVLNLGLFGVNTRTQK